MLKTECVHGYKNEYKLLSQTNLQFNLHLKQNKHFSNEVDIIIYTKFIFIIWITTSIKIDTFHMQKYNLQ